MIQAPGSAFIIADFPPDNFLPLGAHRMNTTLITFVVLYLLGTLALGM